MPKFTTISPTHVPGQKRFAWKQFKEKNYIALGWMHVDLTGKPFSQVKDIILNSDEVPLDQKNDAINHFKKFLSLNKGDFVAVNNTNDGLFGVGVITSDYKYRYKYHKSGPGINDNYYSHTYDVKWIITDYLKRKNIIKKEEKSWQSFGTIGKINQNLPTYIKRLLKKYNYQNDKEDFTNINNAYEFIIPEYLLTVINNIKLLKKDNQHKERAHESIVEDFLVQLGYKKHSQIVFRRGRIDISIQKNNITKMIIEVKKHWKLNLHNANSAIKQAYGYALETGARYVLVTNGDDYLLFDRLKGLSKEDNYVGYFKLTELTQKDLKIVNLLKPVNVFKEE